MPIHLSIMAVFFCLTYASSAQTIEVQPQTTTPTLYAFCVDQYGYIVPNCTVSLYNGYWAAIRPAPPQLAPPTVHHLPADRLT